MRHVIIAAPYFETFDDFKNHIMKESGLKGKNFFKPLRLLLTGSGNGPEVADLYVYLKDFLGEIVK
jgi:glutamyl-tRNA synthetase